MVAHGIRTPETRPTRGYPRSPSHMITLAPDPQPRDIPAHARVGQRLACQRQDEERGGHCSTGALGQRAPAGLSIRIQIPHTPCGRRRDISQRGMGDGHTLPQGRDGRRGWGQLVGRASGPRQLRKKPSRDPPISPPYSRALRSTFIMADLLVDSRAPERYVCVRWRELNHLPTQLSSLGQRRSSAAVRPQAGGAWRAARPPRRQLKPSAGLRGSPPEGGRSRRTWEQGGTSMVTHASRATARRRYKHGKPRVPCNCPFQRATAHGGRNKNGYPRVPCT